MASEIESIHETETKGLFCMKTKGGIYLVDPKNKQCNKVVKGKYEKCKGLKYHKKCYHLTICSGMKRGKGDQDFQDKRFLKKQFGKINIPV